MDFPLKKTDTVLHITGLPCISGRTLKVEFFGCGRRYTAILRIKIFSNFTKKIVWYKI